MDKSFFGIIKNFFFSSANELIAILIALITAPYLARVFNIEVKGEYDYVRSIANYFLLFGMLGFTLSGNRRIATKRDSANNLNIAFSENYYAQFVNCILFTVVYYFWCIFDSKSLIYYVVGIVVISGIFDVGWFYQGIEDFKTIALIRTCVNVFISIVFFLLVKNDSDIILYAFLMACSLLLVNLILFIKLKNRVKFVKVQIGNVFGCLKDALILFLPVISASVYKTMDKVMIGALIGDMAGVSSYSYAEQLINLPLGITNALAAVMLPRMTNAYANNSKDINKTPDITLLFICFLSSAMAFGLVGISDVFVQLYLGSQYLDCVEYVVLLAPTAIMISWTAMMRTQFLIPKKNDKGYITSIVTGALLNLIINFYLLPRIGIYGAIIGTLVAEGAVMIIQTITAANYYDVKKAIKKGCPFLFFGMIMTIECKVIFAQNGTSWRTLFIQIVIGGCSYLLLSFVYFWKQYKSIIQNK